MSERYDQHEVGIPMRRRGQQVGDDRSAIQKDRQPDEWEQTPEISGELRTSESDFLADTSSQHFGGDPVTPDHVTPSTPAAIPSGQPLGQSTGERVFKERQGTK